MKLGQLCCCGSCQWIFKFTRPDNGCPKCKFAYYSAHAVFGNRTYRYAKTQEPWKNQKLVEFMVLLDKELEAEKKRLQKEIDKK